MAALPPDAPTPICYPPRESPGTWTPGDVILTHGETPVSRLIQFGQRIRYRGDDAPFAWWNHAALVVGDDGTLVEALGDGIVETHASKYAPAYFAYIDIALADAEREQVVGYACRAAELETAYGMATNVSLALTLLTNGRLAFGLRGQAICSGLVAESLRAGGYWWERAGRMEPTSWLMPADLAAAFGTERIREAGPGAAPRNAVTTRRGTPPTRP